MLFTLPRGKSLSQQNRSTYRQIYPVPGLRAYHAMRDGANEDMEETGGVMGHDCSYLPKRGITKYTAQQRFWSSRPFLEVHHITQLSLPCIAPVLPKWASPYCDVSEGLALQMWTVAQVHMRWEESCFVTNFRVEGGQCHRSFQVHRNGGRTYSCHEMYASTLPSNGELFKQGDDTVLEPLRSEGFIRAEKDEICP